MKSLLLRTGVVRDVARRFALAWMATCMQLAAGRWQSSLIRLISLMVQLTSLHAAQLVREGDTWSVAPSAAPPARTPSHAGTFVVLHRASLGPRLHFHCKTCNVNVLSSREMACHVTGQSDASMADLASHLTVCSGDTVRTWSKLVGARRGPADKEDNHHHQRQRPGTRPTSKYFGVSKSDDRWRVQLSFNKGPGLRDEKEAALADDRAVTTRGLTYKRLNNMSFPEDFAEEVENQEGSAECAQHGVGRTPQHAKRLKAAAELTDEASEDSDYSQPSRCTRSEGNKQLCASTRACATSSTASPAEANTPGKAPSHTATRLYLSVHKQANAARSTRLGQRNNATHDQHLPSSAQSTNPSPAPPLPTEERPRETREHVWASVNALLRESHQREEAARGLERDLATTRQRVPEVDGRIVALKEHMDDLIRQRARLVDSCHGLEETLASQRKAVADTSRALREATVRFAGHLT
eukprot:jgi/Chlat1/5000/Chrsp32S08949